MVTWQAKAEPETQAQLFDQLAACLNDWDHHRIFPYCAVVRVGGNGHYEAALKKLQACVADLPAEHELQFVMTPLKERGLYNGRMTEESASSLIKLSE